MGIKLGVSLPLLVISIAVISTGADEKGKLLITETCGGTAFPDVCTSTLASDPRSLSADLKGLSRIALELSATKANGTARLVFRLMQHESSYETWAELSACFHGYNISVYRIKRDGLKYFDEGKYKKAYQTVDFLKKEALHCSTFLIPELAKSNTMVSRFTTDVKTILRLLF
jgi:pectinesterase inhibitor-like protein